MRRSCDHMRETRQQDYASHRISPSAGRTPIPGGTACRFLWLTAHRRRRHRFSALLPGFDLHDLSAFTDVFGAANMVEGRSAFSRWRWWACARGRCDLHPVLKSRRRFPYRASPGPTTLSRLPVCASDSADAAVLKAWLQRMARNGSHLAAVGRRLSVAGGGRAAGWPRRVGSLSTRPAGRDPSRDQVQRSYILRRGTSADLLRRSRQHRPALHCVARHLVRRSPRRLATS